MHWRNSFLGGVILLGMMAGLLPASSLAEPKIGVASATKNQVQGILGGVNRELSSGSEVFSKEVVRTGTDSLAQLLFLDQTTLSVGAQSEVKLDRFVYNPNRGGNVAIEVGRGAFRFISGSQNSASYRVKTPLATIGVRGTIFELTTVIKSINSKKVIEEIIQLVQGAISVRTRDGENYDIVKPGTAFLLTDASGPISVKGPIAWDGSIYEIAGKVPYPLYNAMFELDPRSPRPPDSTLDLNDQLNAIILRSEMPPAPKCKLSPPNC
jgi:hypothetical protein